MASSDERPDRDDLTAVATLADPTRRGLYEHVVDAGTPVTRDHVSAASGLERSVVGYHLDKLVDAGLLTATYARPEGRSGPGAGRPAKWYERADTEISVALPPRAYHLAAELLARTLESADASTELRHHLEELATELGRELAPTGTRHDDATAEILACLTACGFEPDHAGDVIRLRNCPFNQLARSHTDLICGMNHALLAGLTEGDAAGLTPSADDDPVTCCVALRPHDHPTRPS